MKKYFSRFHPRYIRSLVYMLQASEYVVHDYLRWLRRVEDFRTVEIRKKIVPTYKARFLLAIAWVMLGILYAGAIACILLLEAPLRIALFVVVASMAPYLLAYTILIPLSLIEIFIQRPITRGKIRRAAEKLHKLPAIKIGVAGSYGKTSMREILVTVIREGKRVAAPERSINTPLGICDFIESLKGDEEVLVFEMGEYYPGDIAYLSRLIRPDIGIITGINEAHLQKFGSIENTTRTIFELAGYLGHKPLYVNGENEYVRKAAAPQHIAYSKTGVADWQIEKAKSELSGTSFELVQQAIRIPVASKLLGLHHIGPLAAAADVASRVGISIEAIARGLNKTSAYDHRLVPIYDPSGVTTLDDSYNGNPDGAAAGIAFLGSLTGRRRFYVTPGLVEMGSQTSAVHKEIGKKLAEAGIEKVVLIKNSVTPYIEQGLKENNFTGEILWYQNAQLAFSALPLLTAKGDVILLQNDWPDQYA